MNVSTRLIWLVFGIVSPCDGLICLHGINKRGAEVFETRLNVYADRRTRRLLCGMVLGLEAPCTFVRCWFRGYQELNLRFLFLRQRMSPDRPRTTKRARKRRHIRQVVMLCNVY